MGRKWTPEEKKAASERAKAKRAAQDKNPKTKSESQDPMYGPQPESVPQMQSLDQGDIQRMVEEMVSKRVAEALAQQIIDQGTAPQFNPWAAPQGMQFGANGLVGTREKYILDPKRYPDPRDKLAKEAKLQRFAFTDNYDMEWQVSVSQYQTKDGVNTREPKFTLKLRRIVFDDDTGLATNQRYVVCQAIFHEDPEAALAIAAEQGFEVSHYAEADFLDEMRYLRMRDWLLEAFYPPKPQVSQKKKEMVIGNRVVEVFEISGEQAQKMPFSQLQSKL